MSGYNKLDNGIDCFRMRMKDVSILFYRQMYSKKCLILKDVLWLSIRQLSKTSKGCVRP